MQPSLSLHQYMLAISFRMRKPGVQTATCPPTHQLLHLSRSYTNQERHEQLSSTVVDPRAHCFMITAAQHNGIAVEHVRKGPRQHLAFNIPMFFIPPCQCLASNSAKVLPNPATALHPTQLMPPCECLAPDPANTLHATLPMVCIRHCQRLPATPPMVAG